MNKNMASNLIAHYNFFLYVDQQWARVQTIIKPKEICNYRVFRF